MEKMLKDSILFAQDDIKARQLHEMQVQADRTIEAIDSALAKDKDMLDKAMFDGIMHARAQLEAVAQDTDETIIKDKIDNLEAISAKFVDRRESGSKPHALSNKSSSVSSDSAMESKPSRT
jgi:molecular chaperone HscA